MNAFSLPADIRAGLQCRVHEASLTLADKEIPLAGDADWQVDVENFPSSEYRINLRRRSAALESASLAFTLDLTSWSPEHYVLLPGAAYAGNRFPSRNIPYPPIPTDEADLGPDTPRMISDVPRLNASEGHSSLVQLTRDCTTPMIAVWDPREKRALFLLCPAATRLGDSGLEIEENADRSVARIALRIPGIRPDFRYSFCSTRTVPSPDRGVGIPQGLTLNFRFALHVEGCADLRAFYARVFALRGTFAGDTAWKHDLPFSSAWQILESKTNRDNWNEREGYYRVGCYDDPAWHNQYQDWQTGWVGGLMNTLPLLALGNPASRARALRTLDFALTRLPAASGLFWGGWSEGHPYGDNFRDTTLPWVMTRKNGDALYFLLKHFDLLQQQDSAWRMPENWNRATRQLADALVRIWDRYGQLGQFLDLERGEIRVGGSCAAGSVPAGLALASAFFREPRYLAAAEAIAAHLVKSFADIGVTTGGPGEILQCPDSESAFGLLESLVVLAEATGSSRWKDDALFMAHQCATWCVSYDYPFPAESEFGRLGLKSLGSVWASVQNKHSAPGICTFSGDALFKLYRMTGDAALLELLSETAHNITQYLSRADRPIRGFGGDVGDYSRMRELPPGWMSERVQLSDFSEPSGEIFAGSCWCEVSCMLTVWEIPGLYVRPEIRFAAAIDHVEMQVIGEDEFTLLVTNPTGYPLVLTVLAESEEEAAKPLGQNALLRATRLELSPGEQRELSFG